MSKRGFDISKMNQKINAECQNCGFKGTLGDIQNHNCKEVKKSGKETGKKKKKKEKKPLLNKELPFIQKWQLRFPDEKLLRNNEVLRGHWSKWHRFKKKWIKLLKPYAELWGDPSELVKISYIRVYGKRARAMDRENLVHCFKWITDAVRDNGMIIDDDPSHADLYHDQKKDDHYEIVIEMERIK